MFGLFVCLFRLIRRAIVGYGFHGAIGLRALLGPALYRKRPNDNISLCLACYGNILITLDVKFRLAALQHTFIKFMADHVRAQR